MKTKIAPIKMKSLKKSINKVRKLVSAPWKRLKRRKSRLRRRRMNR